MGSNAAFIKCFRYYLPRVGVSFENAMKMYRIGRLESLLRELSASEPVTLIPFLEQIIVTPEISDDKAIPIMEGIIDHLRYYMETLASPKDRRPAEPQHDLVSLGKTLLNWLESCESLWQLSGSIAELLKLYARTPESSEDAETLIFCQFRLSDYEDPEDTEYHESRDALSHISEASIRGRTGESAVLLAVNLLKNERMLPPLLRSLLLRFATDSHPGVRVSVLRHLPELAEHDPDEAWRLYQAAFQASPHSPWLWSHGEAFLYHQVRRRFDRVKAYLERIRDQDPDTGAKTWGTVSARACLADHISGETLLRQLIRFNREAAWHGAVDAFKTEITQTETSGVILKAADRFIPFINYVKDICPLEWFYDQVSELSETSPITALQIYENIDRWSHRSGDI